MMDTRETRVIKKKGMLPGTREIIALVAFVVGLGIASVALWLLGYTELAVGITAFFFFSAELLWTLVVFVAGGMWSFKQYTAGAELAMEGRKVEAEQDVAMANAMGRIVDSVIKNAPRLAPAQTPPAPTFDRPEEFAPTLQRPHLLLRDEDN